MDELGAGIAQSRRTVALIKVSPDPDLVSSCRSLLQEAPGTVSSQRGLVPSKEACAQGIAQSH